jgi:threonine dehydratase
MIHLTDIKNAIEKTNLYDVVKKTPVDILPILSEQLNNTIYLKREDLQPVRSFKIRGAYNKIKSLPKKSLSKGIIASSAGNHAQGVALSAQILHIPATIIMPKTTPEIKINSVKKYGATVILEGNNYNEANDYAHTLVRETGKTFIPPYDDIEVIIGQGTVAKEIVEQVQKSDFLFVAVGGGGLLAGILAYVKTVKPSLKVIGVEPEDAACLKAAWEAKTPVTLDSVGIFADGVAVKRIGDIPFSIIQNAPVDDIITVSTDEICSAIKDMYDNCRSMAEPAGAVSLAGLKKYVCQNKVKDSHLVAINCGANMNFDRLRHIAERAQVGEGSEALFSVRIPEITGSFKTFCTLLGNKSITEFNYRYSTPKEAFIFVGIGLKQGHKEKKELLNMFEINGYQAADISNDDVAVIHIRHMVGGKSKDIKNERIIRFQFPELPGALINFLNHLGCNWNISLFHYRNHGSDFGRVLAGIQVPENEKTDFDNFLETLGYSYIDETKNPIIRQFL